MFSHPQQGIEKDEVAALRKEGGAWLRELRNAAGLSQRDLSKIVGLDYYTFISQIESGRGRIPPAMVGKWAAALKYPIREFAINLMKFYDPLNYELIFAGEASDAPKPAYVPAANDQAPESVPNNVITGMQDRMDRLEKLLAKLQP